MWEENKKTVPTPQSFTENPRLHLHSYIRAEHEGAINTAVVLQYNNTRFAVIF